MLSKRLRRAREKAGLTQAQLADKADVKMTVISDIERGKTSVPAYDKLVRIACALDLQPHQLYPVPCCDDRKAG
jgi:transcriptional regulator with XRE-family HTH domain